MKLVLEGGGVRAAYAAGVLKVLRDNGVESQMVIGSSTGSVNAAFYAANQMDTALELWQEFVPSPRFISWRRQLTPGAGPGLGIDTMIDDVLDASGMLDKRRATAGAPDLYITATDIRDATAVLGRPTEASLNDWLRASLAFPGGYNRVVEVDGHPCIDGGVASPVAFDEPLPERYDGPTVVILTRPMKTKKPAPSWYERLFVKALMPARVHGIVLRQHELHNQVMGRLSQAVAQKSVTLVDPPAGMPLSRLTTDRGRIREGIAMGLEVGATLVRSLTQERAADKTDIARA